MRAREAIEAAAAWFDGGGLLAELARRIGIRTESQNRECAARARALPHGRNRPRDRAARLSLVEHWDNPVAARRRCSSPSASRIRAAHGADLRPRRRRRGPRQPVERRPVAVGSSPPTAARWYGRGTADNKGQHTINLAALGQVLAARGRLGFNAKLLLEMGEEVGSPGLRQICETRAASARRRRADRLRRPAPPLGSADDLPGLARRVQFRSRRSSCATARIIRATGAGSLANPGHRARQRDRVDGRRARTDPRRRPPAAADPAIGPARARGHRARRAGWSGDRHQLGRARPDARRARVRLERARGARVPHGQSRPSGQCDSAACERAPAAALRRRLRLAQRSSRPFARISTCAASRRSTCGRPSTSRWRRRASIPSIRGCTGRPPPSRPRPARVRRSCRTSAGRFPTIASPTCSTLPTIWVPHSYPACSQHAPDEHLLAHVAREGLAIMTGMFWDLGEPGSAPRRERARAAILTADMRTRDSLQCPLARV